MSGPPPPPPPHGDNPKTTSPNLPPGKYDIFIIPPHSSGSGFLYLPSLKPNVNSFAAGFASALVLVVLGHSMAPAFKTWWNGFQGMGSVGIMLLVIGVAMGAWSLGRTQIDGGPGPGGGFGGNPGWGPNAGGNFNWAGAGGPTPEAGGPPPPPPPHGSPPPPQSGPAPGTPGGEKPKGSWQQRPEQPPQGEQKQAPPPKPEPEPKPAPQANPWEKAREETRKREAERKAKEADQKRKEEVAKRLKELREKEARERAKREQAAKEKLEKEAQAKAELEKAAKEKADQEARAKEEREKEQKDKELKEKLAKEKEQRESRLREARERDLRERLDREKALREKLEKEAKEREATRLREQAKEEANEATRKSTYAFSAAGEKFNPWPNGRPPSQPSSPAAPNPNPSSPKRPPAPTAKTYSGTVDEETYSYRPYDEPKQRSRRRSGSTVFTESSYAPSQSTARTSPPPSVRGPYTTKDPNKIVIKAVYGFMNQFAKTPASQLISGQGPVTDGLILRITTEGLFIDDDVRGVPQREWDVKAWTLKLMEVWCSSRCFAETPAPETKTKTPNVLHRPARTRVDRGVPKVLTGEEADKFCESMLRTCKDECRLCPHGDYDASPFANSNAAGQSGEWQQRGLHVLRATIRDQEGKRYMFVLGEDEGWKVALGLQRLRKGTQVRQLGVQPMTAYEARNTLETLGWT